MAKEVYCPTCGRHVVPVPAGKSSYSPHSAKNQNTSQFQDMKCPDCGGSLKAAQSGSSNDY